MKIVTALAAAMVSAQALACPLTDTLAARYGISFSGFEKAIPESAAPALEKERSYVRVVIQDKVLVNDGFRHTVLLDVAKKTAWVLRTGGFVPVHQWYGPVPVGDVSVAGCRNEQAEHMGPPPARG